MRRATASPQKNQPPDDASHGLLFCRAARLAAFLSRRLSALLIFFGGMAFSRSRSCAEVGFHWLSCSKPSCRRSGAASAFSCDVPALTESSPSFPVFSFSIPLPPFSVPPTLPIGRYLQDVSAVRHGSASGSLRFHSSNERPCSSPGQPVRSPHRRHP